MPKELKYLRALSCQEIERKRMRRPIKADKKDYKKERIVERILS